MSSPDHSPDTLHRRAVLALRAHRDTRQAELDRAAAGARAYALAEIRRMIVDQPATTTADAVLYAVAAAVDITPAGYPDIVIPRATQRLIRAAAAAGILPTHTRGAVRIALAPGIILYHDASGLTNVPQPLSDARDAYHAAETYRRTTASVAEM